MYPLPNIIRTLTNISIDFNNVLALVSDWQCCIYEEMFQWRFAWPVIKCRACDLLGTYFVSSWRGVSWNLSTDRQLYSKHESHFLTRTWQMGKLSVSPSCCAATDVTMPPNPVVTRWNTWLSATLYHGQHVQYYCTFVENEIAQCGRTVHLCKLLNILYTRGICTCLAGRTSIFIGSLRASHEYSSVLSPSTTLSEGGHWRQRWHRRMRIYRRTGRQEL